MTENVLHATGWKYRTQEWRKKSPSAHHRTNLSSCTFASKACVDNRKSLLNSNTSSRCPHNMANVGPLTAEIALRVWGTPVNLNRTPVNFNRFRILASLLQRRRLPEANQTARSLAVSWAGALYIHFWGCCPLTEFCYVQNSLCVEVLRSRILTALLHGTPAVGLSKLCGVVQGMLLRNFRRGRHLYSAGRSSRSHRPTF